DPAKVRTCNKREGIDLLSPFCFRNRFVKTLDGNEVRAVPLVRRSIRGLQLDRFLKLTLSRSAIPVPAKLDKRHRRVRFCRALVDLECTSRCFLRLRKTFFRLETTINDEHVVAVSESCVCRAVVRIDRDRLVEKLD